MNLSIIKDFRKLEKKLGKETSDVLLSILKDRDIMTTERLATKDDMSELQKEFQILKADLHRLEVEMKNLEVRVNQAIGRIAWKTAGLLIAQTAVLMGLLKIVGVY